MRNQGPLKEDTDSGEMTCSGFQFGWSTAFCAVAIRGDDSRLLLGTGLCVEFHRSVIRDVCLGIVCHSSSATRPCSVMIPSSRSLAVERAVGLCCCSPSLLTNISLTVHKAALWDPQSTMSPIAVNFR